MMYYPMVLAFDPLPMCERDWLWELHEIAAQQAFVFEACEYPCDYVL
jgi:hypothetical protein